MRAIVTGATSMLGCALMGRLLAAGHEVVAVARPGSSRISRLDALEGVEKVCCGLDSYRMLPDMINGKADVFYHLAWPATGGNAARNADSLEQLEGTRAVIEAVRAASKLGCRLFVGTGSQAEYGPRDGRSPVSPRDPVDPVQLYGIAKYAAGKFARAECNRLGMSCSWVRVFSVYGELDSSGTMISSAVRTLLEGRHPSFTPAEQPWDYLYADDAGEALRLIGERSHGDRVYCLGSGEPRPLKEFIREMGEVTAPGVELGIGDLPYPEGRRAGLWADISDVTEDTGWLPSTTFREGIARVVESARDAVMHSR